MGQQEEYGREKAGARTNLLTSQVTIRFRSLIRKKKQKRRVYVAGVQGDRETQELNRTEQKPGSTDQVATQTSEEQTTRIIEGDTYLLSPCSLVFLHSCHFGARGTRERTEPKRRARRKKKGEKNENARCTDRMSKGKQRKGKEAVPLTM